MTSRMKSLTPADLVRHIVACAPFPYKFQNGPESTTLGDLGVSASTARGFVRGIQAKVRPWHLDSNIAFTNKSLTVQQVANALELMVSKPPLDPDDLVRWIVASSPLPKEYEGDPAIKLGILGVNATTAQVFISGVQERILPWLINGADVVVAEDKTVQDCAFSVNLHAY